MIWILPYLHWQMKVGMMESIKTAMDGTIGTQTMTEWMIEPWVTNTPRFIMELFPMEIAMEMLFKDLESTRTTELWVSQDMGQFTEDVLVNRISLKQVNTIL